MSKRITASVAMLMVVILMPGIAFGQFRYGLRVGGMIPTGRLADSEARIEKRSGGFSGGLTCEYQMPKGGFAFDASVMYTHLGANLSVPEQDQGKSGSLAKDFLHIPLNVKYKFWIKKYKELVAPYVYTGPDLLIKMNGTKETDLYPTRTWQPGWNVGVGFDAINFLQIQAGYRFGLTNTLRVPGSFHNDGVNISVALLFDI